MPHRKNESQMSAKKERIIQKTYGEFTVLNQGDTIGYGHGTKVKVRCSCKKGPAVFKCVEWLERAAKAGSGCGKCRMTRIGK